MKIRMALFVDDALWLGVSGGSRGSASRAGCSGTAGGNNRHATDRRAGLEVRVRHVYRAHRQHSCISSLWAEMLDDRKFYFPITSKEREAPARQQGDPFAACGFANGSPVGPDEVVVMDKEKPFVGDQSPRIELDAATPHGIRQSGLALVKGKQYTGRIYLRGTAWQQGEGLADLGCRARTTGRPSRLPRSPTSTRSSRSASRRRPIPTDGAIEITGTGKGNFHIGTLSLMPADNIAGIPPRHDCAAAPDQIGLLAVRRQLHFRADLVPHCRRHRQASAGLRLCVERHADERRGPGRVHDVVQADRRGAVYQRQRGLRRLALGGGRGRVHERIGQHAMGASARRTAIRSRTTSSSGTSATSPGAPGSLAAPI